MSVYLLRKEGPHYRHDNLEFWSEDGLVVWEDQNTGEFGVVTCADFKARAWALYKESQRPGLLASDEEHLKNWCTKMALCHDDAKTQGDPTDPAVLRQRVRERRKVSLVTGLW